MTHFHELFHGNCTLRHIGEILELRKLNFRGLKGQFDIKKANFRGSIAEIVYLITTLEGLIFVGINFRGSYFRGTFFCDFAKNRENRFRENAQDLGSREN